MALARPVTRLCERHVHASVSGMRSIVLRAAVASDRDAVVALLVASGLPVAGLTRDFPDGYVVAVDDAELLGCAGVEPYGEAGLLRSVAVGEAARRRGLGRRLVADRQAWAASQGLSALYLLTEGAAEYFVGLGFRPVERGLVAPAVQASDEFTTTCPRSAACMQLFL